MISFIGVVLPAMAGHVEKTWFGLSTRRPMPSNCESADDRIEESIYERFAQDLDIDAATIKVGVLNGEVTLTGSVESGHNMRLAEEIASSVSGVRRVDNQIAEELPKLP